MLKTWRRLKFEPQLALPVPHGAIAEPAGGRGPGDVGERPGVNGDVRHLLLQRGQLAVLYDAEHVQQAQRGEHLTHVTGSKARVQILNSVTKKIYWKQGQQQGNLRESSEVNLIAATQ